ncbi:M48 family metalloprotease [Nonomuraea sp. NPDC050556]|uniref:M48 family metalloprotease n=1 Tax=Nonomuraea sp. NPDC050556 TaxID=3364369 RepID=UPI0037944C70
MALLAAVYAAVLAVLLRAGVPVEVVVTGGAAILLAQWWWTEAAARRAIGARVVDRSQEPELHAVLDRLCALSGLPRPRLAVSPTLSPNAYTIGRGPRSVTIIVTEGLRRRLSPDELTAVLAHEIAHIRHRDVAVMTLASSFTIFLQAFGRHARQAIRRVPVLLFLLFPALLMLTIYLMVIGALAGVASFVAHVPLRALNRARELAADRAAAELLGQPALLASALLKLHDAKGIPLTDLRAGAYALGVVACRTGSGLMATHPHVNERVRRLLEGHPR